jgi:hypothetical protein
MHGPINVKSPNNTSKWQMGFNSLFKGLMGQSSSASSPIYIGKSNENFNVEEATKAQRRSSGIYLLFL